MGASRLVKSVIAAAVWLALTPALASAQSVIAGAVKDTSGAVLPGVTVEAASPALIEQVRSVLTDGQGRYSIVDLRPGVYTVTFTLTALNTVKREGLELQFEHHVACPSPISRPGRKSLTCAQRLARLQADA
jgi:carboxypeptidase family protein